MSDRVPFECLQKPMAWLRHPWAKNVSQKVTWTTEFQHFNRTTFFLWLWRWLPHRLPKRQSPGRSYWTKLWNDSWGQTFHSFSILSFPFAEKRINIRHQSHPYIHWLEIRREKRITDLRIIYIKRPCELRNTLEYLDPWIFVNIICLGAGLNLCQNKGR